MLSYFERENAVVDGGLAVTQLTQQLASNMVACRGNISSALEDTGLDAHYAENIKALLSSSSGDLNYSSDRSSSDELDTKAESNLSLLISVFIVNFV